MKSTELLVQHNAITFARYEMSLTEKRIVYLMLSQIRPDQGEFEKIEIPASKILENFAEEGPDSENYTLLRHATKKLLSRVYEIEEENGLLQVSLISHARYRKGSGKIEVGFSNEMKPYLLQLKEKFTTYKLRMAMDLSSTYSQRMYEILSEYKDTGWWIVKVEDLKKLFVLENRYKNYNDFKKKVIIKAQADLAELTDIQFTFEEIKKVRKVDRLRFDIIYRPKEFSQEIPFPESMLMRLTQYCQLSQSAAKKILAKVPEKEIQRTIVRDIQMAQVNGKIKGSIASFSWGVFRNKYPELEVKEQGVLF